MAHDVFISHSSKDKAIADAICAALESHDIRCWIAPRDIQPGKDWPTAIVNAIKKSKIMVLIFSQNSNSSHQVKKELSVAVNSEAVVIPFRIDNIPFQGAMELFLSDTHWLDAMNPPTEKEISRLVKTVESFIRNIESPEKTREDSPQLETKLPVQDQQLSESSQSTSLIGLFSKIFLSHDGRKKSLLEKVGIWFGLIGTIAVIIILTTQINHIGPNKPSETLTVEENQALKPQMTKTLPPTNTVEPLRTKQPTNTPIPTKTNSPSPTTKPTQKLPTQIEDKFGVSMVLIPAGDFSMGEDVEVVMEACQKMDDPYSGESCDPSVYEEEAPLHTRTLDEFYIDKYEVTNAAYASCVKAGACEPPNNLSSFTRSQYYGNPLYEDYPVIFVDWWDAKTYCEWREGHLPTEAEWEKAARGTDGRLFPWGDRFEGSAMNSCDKVCPLDWANENYNDGFGDTSPVGSFPEGSSPYGAMDMAGNVWEWTSDWFDNYPGGDPHGSEYFGYSYRVFRGGSWGYYGISARTTNRGASKPNKIYNYTGIRCARDAKQFDE